mgnify:CR=1 FL=1
MVHPQETETSEGTLTPGGAYVGYRRTSGETNLASQVLVVPVTDAYRVQKTVWSEPQWDSGYPVFSMVVPYNYRASESAGNASTHLNDYAPSWECEAIPGLGTPTTVADKTDSAEPTQTVDFSVPVMRPDSGDTPLTGRSGRVNCTATNVLDSSSGGLVVGLTADPNSGDKLNPGESITYTLTFDNSSHGRLPAGLHQLPA